MRTLPLFIGVGLVIAAGILIQRRSDSVTTHFQTIQEARVQGAIERGWLPPVLPDSTRDITEKNDLDTNSGDGEFTFGPADYSSFVARLKPAPHGPMEDALGERIAAGFSIFTYSRSATIWILALHPNGSGFYKVSSRAPR